MAEGESADDPQVADRIAKERAFLEGMRQQLEQGVTELGVTLMPVREMQADLRAQAVVAGFGEDVLSPTEEPPADYGEEEAPTAHAVEERVEMKKARAIDRVTEGTGWETYDKTLLRREMDRIGNTPMQIIGSQVAPPRAQRLMRTRTRSPPRRMPAARSVSRPADARRRERTPAPLAYAGEYVETFAKRWAPAMELKAKRQRFHVKIEDPALKNADTLMAYAITDPREGDLIFNLRTQPGEFFDILDMTNPMHFAWGRTNFDARTADAVQSSRLLNKILRHRLKDWGLFSDSGAWTPTSTTARAVGLSLDQLVELVARDTEGRFSGKVSRGRWTSPTSGRLSPCRWSISTLRG